MYSDGSTVLTEAQGNGNPQAQQGTFLLGVSMPPLGASVLPSRKGKAAPTVSQDPFPSESWGLKRLEPVSSPTLTPGCDLGLISVWGGGGEGLRL